MLKPWYAVIVSFFAKKSIVTAAFFEKCKKRSIGMTSTLLFSAIAYSCFWALIFTPGPIVDAVTQVRMYWPFAAAGFALMMAPISAA